MATLTRARVDPRLEALASAALEHVRGRAPIAPAPRAGGVAARVVAPLLRDRGASLSDLQRNWAEIVGERLGKVTTPEKLAAGVLTLKVPGAAAPYVQQQLPLILDRANLAGAKITSLAIRQGAPPTRAVSNVAPVDRVLTQDEETAMSTALTGLGPGRLRDSLMRLGRAVLTR
jgi:hypothetical protein